MYEPRESVVSRDLAKVRDYTAKGYLPCIKGLRLLTHTAQALGIRVSASPEYTRANMQQEVISATLANHKIAVGVVSRVLVYVMYFNPDWQRFSKSALRYNDVLKQAPSHAFVKCAGGATTPVAASLKRPHPPAVPFDESLVFTLFPPILPVILLRHSGYLSTSALA